MKRQIFSRAPLQSLLFLLSFLLVNIETQAVSLTVVASERMPTVSMLVYTGLSPTRLAEVNWEEFKRIKRGAQPGEVEQPEESAADSKVESKRAAKTVSSKKPAAQKPAVQKSATQLTYPVVYTRVSRTHGEHAVTLSSGDYTSDNWDYMDSLPEVARQFNGFNAPGQLVLRAEDGTEKIIYDCMEAERPCVPFDAMPSLDGTKIAFSVYSADGLKPPWPENRNYPQIGRAHV